ncbi:nuclear transport factor 2 family protein [Cupriavidus pauculus]|uniref:SnoaL-like domain-containing protein n=1 Tax=Cupriavidus pauculus TaxID=82633 RepID=A0A2N5CDW6_9BURK|nr:nuclear transport factor 2 family protein [Cupriavidus pauculus]PLQ00430.1 hypothetical protein CYJ10_12460 [Cupriavidus pauculus]
MPTPAEIVMASYEAYNAGNVEGVLMLFADEVEWEFVGPQSELRYAGPRRTKAEIRDVLLQMGEDEEVHAFGPTEDIIECGDRLVVIGEIKGKVKCSGRHCGREYVSPWVHIFTLREGKIVGWRGFYDTAARLL